MRYSNNNKRIKFTTISSSLRLFLVCVFLWIFLFQRIADIYQYSYENITYHIQLYFFHCPKSSKKKFFLSFYLHHHHFFSSLSLFLYSSCELHRSVHSPREHVYAFLMPLVCLTPAHAGLLVFLVFESFESLYLFFLFWWGYMYSLFRLFISVFLFVPHFTIFAEYSASYSMVFSSLACIYSHCTHAFIYKAVWR